MSVRVSVDLYKVTSTVEGDIDLLGILGLSDGTVRNGYNVLTNPTPIMIKVVTGK
jgi:hypothetical protein